MNIVKNNGISNGNPRRFRLLNKSRLTWLLFVVFIVLNITTPFIGAVISESEHLSGLGGWLIDIPIYQVFGLSELASDIGIDVSGSRPGGSELFGEPNTLGWFLIVFPILLSLAIHYLIAYLIARRVYQK